MNQSEKLHQLVTVQDMVQVVTKKNLDCFLRDFDKFFRAVIDLKEAGLITAPSVEKMTWIDDGENNLTVNVSYKI